MTDYEPIRLSREVNGLQIPAGTPVVLEEGTEVRITQSLGGTYTVTTDIGLIRIAGKDADALGKDPTENAEIDTTPKDEAKTKEEVEVQVWEQLRTVYDPEIPVDVVELGLVYDCKVVPLSEGSHKVSVTMTLTAPGCGMGDVLRLDAETKIGSLSAVSITEVNLVVDPPWNPALMSDAARLQLGMF